jgi:hypothetical protein
MAGYVRAYFKCFFWNGVATRSQYIRFYLVNLVFTSAALYGLFFHHGFVEWESSLGACVPKERVPYVAFLVLAEGASFVFLIFSYVNVVFKSQPLCWRRAYKDLTTVGHRLEWRLYRLLWIWFPWTVLAISELSWGAVRDVVNGCVSSGGTIQFGQSGYRLQLFWALIWPNALLVLAPIVFVYWFFVRWKSDGSGR